MAVLFTMNILYLVFHEYGTLFLLIVSVGIGYGYFGQFLSGTLSHGGLSPRRILQLLALNNTGFFGFLTQLTAAWISLFLLYSAFLEVFGGFDVIFNAAGKADEYVESGVLQAAVISSAIIGSINGSQTANASMTGSITIPLMKRNGVKPEIAAAVESVASTSGQVLPPVMGAGAFVMASLLGIPYSSIIVAGAIPALILVVSVVAAVHIIGKEELDTESSMNISSGSEKTLVNHIFDSIRLLVPFGILVYTLGILQWTIVTSAFYTAMSMMVLGIVLSSIETMNNSELQVSVADAIYEEIKNAIAGFRSAAHSTAPIAIIMAAIGGVVAILQATGVPGAIALRMVGLTGGVLIVAALLSLVLCIVLGLGMPTVAAYTVVALLVAPTLINSFGVPPLAAHFFVFYAAILAGLTPPIAVVSAVAAGIAEANFLETAYHGMKISISLFLLPFVFIYHPEILISPLSYEGIISVVFALIGSVGVIYSLNSYISLNKPASGFLRISYLIAGLLSMISGDALFQALGVIALPLIYLIHKKMHDIRIFSDPISALRSQEV